MATFSVLLTLAALTGCGVDHPTVAPVSGTVTVDGKPVEGAAVMFVPKEGGRVATGRTDAQGHFTLTTFSPNDGAIVGEHSVAIKLAKSTGGAKVMEGGTMGEMTGRVRTTYIVPPKYGDPKTSGLTKSVSSGEPNKFTFELSSG